jgi:hypothetical protein
MANIGNRSHELGDRGIFSSDVWISEKRGMSLARDLKTGRLLSIAERRENEERRRNDGERNDTVGVLPRLWRAIRGTQSEPL